MNSRSLSLLATMAVALAGLASGCVNATTPDNDPEAYAVYSAILPEVWMVRVAHANRLIIISDTSTQDLKLEPRGDSEKLLRGALQSYQRLNAHQWQLKPRFRLGMPYEIIPAGGFAAQLETTYSERPRGASVDSLYPGARGVVSLSAVGFNGRRDVAVVQMHWYCGFLCGGAETYALQKKAGAWTRLAWDGTSEVLRY